MSNKLLVSIVIPTKNSAVFLDSCLKSIQMQSYSEIEIIIVDGKSTDNVRELAEKYNCVFYTYIPKVKEGTFDAPHKRNYGMKKAKGEYVYWLDADMELSKDLIIEAVNLCEKGADAVILPEDSFGIGIWASAKNLERRCYWGDDAIEAPRFIKKDILLKLGGLDELLGGGGDDWDLYQKLLENGYRVERTKNMVRHNEGNLKLRKLLKKRFMYGKDSFKYVFKRPKAGITSYFPIRKSYIKNWKLFLNRPVDSFFFIIMRSMEYLAGAAGALYSLFSI